MPLFKRSRERERLDSIEEKMQQMLRHDRHEFELAMSALMGQVDGASVNDELRATDQKVNALEREIRRELLVHTSVFGGIDTPTVLVYMSVVKDIERVGDYAKNLLDIAIDGAHFADVPTTAMWRGLFDEIAEYITDAGEAFQRRDEDASRELLNRGSELLGIFDERVSALVRGENGGQPVARALAHRYLKRIVAHLMNVLSAVIMPLDMLDYFDEDPEDRIG